MTTGRSTERELVWSATRKDFRIDWFSGSGPGGQNRNKHQNCCRITHLESGLVAQSTRHKERPSNQRDAFNRLAKMLIEHYELRGKTVEVEGNKQTIRTYHEPRNVVKDHASGLQQEYRYVVEGREIGEMAEARKRALMEQGED